MIRMIFALLCVAALADSVNTPNLSGSPAIYDVTTGLLTLPRVQVGQTVYDNLTVKIDGSNVVTMGSAEVNGAPLPYCTPVNITQKHYAAVKLGMTLDQVNALIGCQPDPGQTNRSSTGTAMNWVATGTVDAAECSPSSGPEWNMSITVFFDPLGRIVSPTSGVASSGDAAFKQEPVFGTVSLLPPGC